MTTIQEVSAMLPVLTPYRMPSEPAQAQSLYDIADSVVSTEVSATGTMQTRAYCYYIAHLLSAKDGSANATSEHLGAWSVTYKTAANGVSYWLSEYLNLKNTLSQDSIYITASVPINDTYPHGGGM